MSKLVGRFLIGLVIAAVGIQPAWAQAKQEFVPTVGQPGKDVVWVPSPEETVAKMMEVGKITSRDFVVDLGSGDGRNVIAAAKLGARGLGVEYNNDMVELSKRLAAKEGVTDRAQFVQGDMYQADFSKATVLALFLLTSNLQVLRDKIFNLQPGTRVVLNTFPIPEWTADEQVTVENCQSSWCTVYLNIVPAKIGGTWRTQNGGEVSLTQTFQMLTGSSRTPDGQTSTVSGRLRGNELTMSNGKQEFTGVVKGNVIEGTQRPVGGGAPQQVTLTRVK
ncbi:MAG TPA: class I SAM-dependent methyltransferase [Vicinamibacterales bacterium]|nr:class I SAM-dependent methyltransferase [Vicinamibacterales bacterium]